ncbi:MAG: PilT/PilU family type 4a pilus ATPase [Chlamydiae bacterium]|nr:PilT/PilU family type 4a pilus ATPase [Chlamydiota bacterium]MBI3276409.1 PilT/PilU family type 4a pilus ATPase [Chlamydiota bacterium]
MNDTIVLDKPVKSFGDFFPLLLKLKASDLHLQVGSPPIFRIAGVPKKLGKELVTTEILKNWIREILPQEKYELLLKKRDMDHSYSVENYGRLRINLFFQRGHLSLAGRLVPTQVPSMEGLHLPEVLKNISELHDGLVIVAGVTGCGKSTTLAAMIEHINQTRNCHILTVEDPIEYLYTNKKALINQREIGIDTESFKEALKYALREDPNIILIGEMRDAETVQFGLNAAETGHLVFGTIHSSNSAQTIGRMIDLFPPDQHYQMRQALQFNLRSVISQKLLPCIKEGVQRVPAVEVMIVDATIRELIRQGQDLKIHNAIRGGTALGMQDYNQSLLGLVKEGLISQEVAIRVSPNPEAFRMNMKGIFLDDEKAIF